MIDPGDLLSAAYFPAIAITLFAGLAIAAASRDLVKRLLGVAVAALSGVAGLAVIAAGDPGLATGALAAGLLVFTGASLGVALLVHVREAFGGVDAIGLQLVESADDRAEQAE